MPISFLLSAVYERIFSRYNNRFDRIMIYIYKYAYRVRNNSFVYRVYITCIIKIIINIYRINGAVFFLSRGVIKNAVIYSRKKKEKTLLARLIRKPRTGDWYIIVLWYFKPFSNSRSDSNNQLFIILPNNICFYCPQCTINARVPRTHAYRGCNMQRSSDGK